MQNRENAYTEPGGDTVLMDRLARGLRGRGYEVTIDLVGSEDPKQFSLIHLFNFATPHITKNFAEKANRAGVPFVVTTLAEDVPTFHTQSHHLAARLIEYVRKNQQPLVWYQNGLTTVPSPSAPFDNRWIVEHAAALLANGTQESRILEAQYGHSIPVYTVPIGLDPNAQGNAREFCAAYGVSDYILCVGRFESRKNQLMLLKALEHIDIPLVLVSNGVYYQPDYAQAVKSFVRRGKTIIAERLSDSLLASAYAGARVHALPSWFELPGLVSLEAAAAGAAIVACDTGTTRDYLMDRVFWCKPDDEHSILQATLAAYYSPIEMRALAREYAKKWTLEKSLDALCAVYETVLSNQAAKTHEISYASNNFSTSPWSASPSELFSPNTINTPSTVNELPAAILKAIDDVEQIIQRGNLAQASVNLANIEAEYPNNPRILRNRGVLHFMCGDFHLAKPVFARAIAVNPSDGKALTGLAMCAMQYGDFNGAFAHLIDAIKYEPYHLGTIHQLIQCSYQIGKYNELVVALERFCARFVENKEIKFCLAGALIKAGKVERARVVAEDVLRLDPTHKGANEILHNYSSLSPVLKIIPQPQDNNFTLTLLEEEKRKKNSSYVISECDKLIQSGDLSPNNFERATLLKAESLIMEGKLDEARSIYDAVLNRNPNSSRALCGRAALLAHTGNWEIAETLFKQAREIDSSNDVAFAGLGLCSQRREEYSASWEWYHKSLQLNPENTRALLGVIEVGYTLGKLSEIEEALLVYLEHHPADLDFVYSLAGCYFKQHRLSDAESQLEKIKLFKPDHPLAYELGTKIAECRAKDSKDTVSIGQF
jgi:tetratricopeptide (TPR) repeat protein